MFFDNFWWWEIHITSGGGGVGAAEREGGFPRAPADAATLTNHFDFMTH